MGCQYETLGMITTEFVRLNFIRLYFNISYRLIAQAFARFSSISGSFGFATVVLARLRFAKMRTIVQLNYADMSAARKEKVCLGIKSLTLTV